MRNCIGWLVATLAAVVLFAVAIGIQIFVVGGLFTATFWIVDFLFGTQFFSWTCVGMVTLLFICFRLLLNNNS